ncbi:class I SAM-dependent methyltransferase [Thalassotalea litorea]|uniref:Class I SAM-dependent methyltransferase n=1 Tax=Thalassotalea litorea TaxID=2020715 RepID=A0A5R9ID16_9GAMM|nr:class I SAM-dependent methyltransferase [Thalassotalea litorea]TLU61486.1 class I SAM-dependent methyltransferase [Thalassotalea litorea]
MTKTSVPHPASFRDPAGYVFIKNNQVYRKINTVGKAEFDSFYQSKFYKELTSRGWLIPHLDVSDEFELTEEQAVIKPQPIPYISYPYEWCFSQLKDAALLTLDIQLLALEHGFTLKDASAFNIQFINSRPVFIDTLSFTRYDEGPWVAYRQFCQHFLAPLLLTQQVDYRFSLFSRNFIDGLPLDFVSKLLPKKSWVNFGILSHLHLHAKSQRHFSDVRKLNGASSRLKSANLNAEKLTALISNLRNTVNRLFMNETETEWGDYYQVNDYSSSQSLEKKAIVEAFLNETHTPLSLIADLGSNSGEFTQLCGLHCQQVVAFDVDFRAIEALYQRCVAKPELNILPLLFDLTNPSPGIGWHNRERESFMHRAKFDLVMVLAVIHHMVIGNNVPLDVFISSLATMTKRYLIIEFVDKKDSQVQRMLSTRKDIFIDYNISTFEKAIHNHFDVVKSAKIEGSHRNIYLLKKHHA